MTLLLRARVTHPEPGSESACLRVSEPRVTVTRPRLTPGGPAAQGPVLPALNSSSQVTYWCRASDCHGFAADYAMIISGPSPAATRTVAAAALPVAGRRYATLWRHYQQSCERPTHESLWHKSESL